METILSLQFSSIEYICAAVKQTTRNLQFCKFQVSYPLSNSHSNISYMITFACSAG